MTSLHEVVNFIVLLNLFFTEQISNRMFDHEVHGWLEGPDPNYKQVLPLRLFI